MYADWRDTLAEVESVDGDEVRIIVASKGDMYYSVIVDKKHLVKIGELDE